MGWFANLFGADRREGETRASAKARRFLEQAAALAKLEAVRVIASDEFTAELRGTLYGLDVRVITDEDYRLRACGMRYSGGEREFIDLDYDPDLERRGTALALEPWDASDEVIHLAPGISIDGSSAKREVAAFRALPQALQDRVLREMKRLQISSFRSRPDEHDTMVGEDGNTRANPAQWLADILTLQADVARARGKQPFRAAPGEGDAGDDEDDEDADEDDEDDEDDDTAPRQGGTGQREPTRT